MTSASYTPPSLDTWQGVQLAIDCLYCNIKEELDNSLNIKIITGVPRGGLIPAVMLSHKLKIPFLSINTVVSDFSIRPHSVLVVEDIVCTGDTLLDFNKKGFITAALALRKGSKATPNFYYHFEMSDKWLTFPWESPSSPTQKDGTLPKELLKG